MASEKIQLLSDNQFKKTICPGRVDIPTSQKTHTIFVFGVGLIVGV